MYQTADCKYDTLRYIGLESLANPIDLPVTITISSHNAGLYNPRWTDTSRTNSGNNSIILQPGERIGWSNYTNVGNWQIQQPLWFIDIDDNPSVWLKQEKISLQVRVAFSDIRDRWIESIINYPIHPIE
jgi:hypothetical protein